ncbi:MAG: hypothetical protein U0269_15195 [Polyangiales bacterium]
MKRALLFSSIALTVAWVSLRSLGWWRYAAVLSGTVPEGASSVNESVGRALAVLLVHFAFVLLAAPMALTAAVMHGLDRRRARQEPSRNELKK